MVSKPQSTERPVQPEISDSEDDSNNNLIEEIYTPINWNIKSENKSEMSKKF